jgi:uncharacterized protein
MARLNYVELPVRDIGASRAFYEAAFGWSLTEFGPTYAATLTGDTDIGLQADAEEATAAPLPVIDVDDLEAALAAVEAAGAKIVSLSPAAAGSSSSTPPATSSPASRRIEAAQRGIVCAQGCLPT